MFTRYVATKDLFQALIRAKRPVDTIPPDAFGSASKRDERDELAPDTYREDLRFED